MSFLEWLARILTPGQGAYNRSGRTRRQKTRRIVAFNYHRSELRRLGELRQSERRARLDARPLERRNAERYRGEQFLASLEPHAPDSDKGDHDYE